jgi:hypothetical protein
MTSEELTQKKKVRAAHRTSVTRLLGQADALIDATPVNADELALLQTNLSTKLTTLETLNKEIVEIIPEVQLEDEIGRADEYSERIQRSLLRISKALKPPPPTDKSRDPPPRNPRGSDPPPTDGPPDPISASGGTVAGGKVKLPKISLPRFKGNPLYWTAFWDSYESAVHLNSALSDVDKFNYLRSLLEKSALD